MQLARAGLPRGSPADITSKAVPAGRAAPFSLATLVPLVLILMTITGAVYPAIDLTAGERERGTLETLIAAPISRMSLLIAKYLAVLTVAVLTALVNLIAMSVTVLSSSLYRAAFSAGPIGHIDGGGVRVDGALRDILFRDHAGGHQLRPQLQGGAGLPDSDHVARHLARPVEPHARPATHQLVGHHPAGKHRAVVARPAGAWGPSVDGHLGDRIDRPLCPVGLGGRGTSFWQRRPAVCQPWQLVGLVAPPDRNARTPHRAVHGGLPGRHVPVLFSTRQLGRRE